MSYLLGSLAFPERDARRFVHMLSNMLLSRSTLSAMRVQKFLESNSLINLGRCEARHLRVEMLQSKQGVGILSTSLP
eukprot:235290-Amphidinium_carterae.1